MAEPRSRLRRTSQKLQLERTAAAASTGPCIYGARLRSVDGSANLCCRSVDPGELRLDLPVGAGGLSNIRRVRDSTDERLAVLQKSADGSTWTDVGEVTIPEPDPRILRRIAVRDSRRPVHGLRLHGHARRHVLQPLHAASDARHRHERLPGFRGPDDVRCRRILLGRW